jgi:hypothetical protein
MIVKILTNGWFVFLAVTCAAASLFILYRSGRTTEALIGSGVLVVAIILIIIGGKKNSPRQ